VRERDHVAFDILYHAAPERGRKIMAIAGAVFVIGIMVYSFIPTWEAIMTSRLMELKKIQTLRIPITGDKIPVKWLFASYVLLMVVVIIRYLWTLIYIAKHGAPKDHQEQLLEELSADKGEQS